MLEVTPAVSGRPAGNTLDESPPHRRTNTERQFRVTHEPGVLPEVARSRRTRREPTQRRGEHVKSTQKDPHCHLTPSVTHFSLWEQWNNVSLVPSEIFCYNVEELLPRWLLSGRGWERDLTCMQAAAHMETHTQTSTYTADTHVHSVECINLPVPPTAMEKNNKKSPVI